MTVFIIKRQGVYLSDEEKKLIKNVIKGKGKINVLNVDDNISVEEQEEMFNKISGQKVKEKVIIVMFTFPPLLLARLSACVSASPLCELYLIINDGELRLVKI